MARFGGPFHLCQSISRPFKKKHYLNHELRGCRSQRGCQKLHGNWHRAAQKMMSETQSVLVAAS
jgi:hypothetical protein